MLLRKLRGMLMTALAGSLAVLAVEAILFLSIFSHHEPVAPADAVVVFDGSMPRIAKGASLANSGAAPVLVISPASPQQIAAYRKRFAIDESVAVIPEPSARTTYENAYYTAGVIRRQNFSSIVLVTADYHMPRSFILLKLMLAGTGVTIERAPLDTNRSKDRAGRRRNWKRLYNEGVLVWGSLYELAHHRLCGETASRAFRKSKAVRALEKLLLFE